MTEKIVNAAWWTLIMALAAATGVGGLVLAYRGMFELMAMRLDSGGLSMVAAIALGGSTLLLARYRSDLVCTTRLRD
jgi:hypothetical protein